jgi:hypothetical protein
MKSTHNLFIIKDKLKQLMINYIFHTINVVYVWHFISAWATIEDFINI